MNRVAGLLLAGLAVWPTTVPDKAEPVRVYVFTARSASGQATEEEKGRLDAVREMRDALAKKKGLTIVNERSAATVLVEVVGREEREGAMGGLGGKTVTRMGDTIIRLHVTEGDAQTDLKGIGQGTFGRAAKDAADRVTKWIARAQRPLALTGVAATAPRRH